MIVKARHAFFWSCLWAKSWSPTAFHREYYRYSEERCKAWNTFIPSIYRKRKDDISLYILLDISAKKLENNILPLLRINNVIQLNKFIKKKKLSNITNKLWAIFYTFFQAFIFHFQNMAVKKSDVNKTFNIL